MINAVHNWYIVVAPSGKAITESLAPTHSLSTSLFLNTQLDSEGRPWNDWVWWVSQGYRCVNVDVNFSERT